MVAVMEARPMGRPKSNRDDKPVKIDRHIVSRAKVIAESRGQSMAEYVSEVLRPIVDRDFPKAIKTLQDSGRGHD